MIDIHIPAEQDGTRAVVRAWLRAIGDTVAIDDPLVELETDKVTQEVPSPAAGILAEILLNTDDEAVPGALLGRIRPVATEAGVPVAAEPIAPPPASAPDRAMRLSPSVRRAVREHGVDAATIAGTGRDGRVTRADIDRHVAGRTATPGGSRSIPHDRMRRAIAANMRDSVTTAPHVTAVFEADCSAIVAHRARHRAAFAAQGIALTYTAHFIAAAVAAMHAAPAINSRWHDDRLEVFDDVNIGVGTALDDRGLVVPVVARAQTLSLAEIAARVQDLTTRARADRLTPGDVRGGTFSISNHGVSGSLFAAPIIIAQPQSAILGIGKLEKRVVVRTVDGIDTIQIRPMAFVSLTIDHRVVDGHQANGWLSAFVAALEGWPVDKA